MDTSTSSTLVGGDQIAPNAAVGTLNPPSPPDLGAALLAAAGSGDVKSAFSSKTLWGIAALGLAFLLQRSGHTIAPADAQAVVDVAAQFVAAAGAGLALVGRLTAKKGLV